jgi:uncharacterized protein YifE (UPF0438 family)
MADLLNIGARQCCTREKDRLVKVLRGCDNNAQSPEERHRCYRSAAKNSGRRSRECLISG